MKNVIKHLIHRAIQTACIAAICAVFVNLLYINKSNPSHLRLDFDWIWIINAIIMSAVSAFIYVFYMNIKQFKYDDIEYGTGPLWETIIAIIIGFGFCITSAYYSGYVTDAISLGTVAITAILALFWPETARSLVFALMVSAIVGIFLFLDYENFLEGSIVFAILNGVVIVARIIRWAYIFLFVTKHSYLRIEKSENE